MDPVVILGTDSVAVGPGEQARLPVRIRNQSRRVESYRVDVVGAAAAFARVEPPTVSVLPGREAELDVLFTPPGGASAPSGTVAFAVRATSEVEASYSAVAEGHLELAGVTGLQVWAVNNEASGRWSGRYQIELANHGNAATRLAVSARDQAAALRVTVERELVDLRPGGRATTQVTAKARHPFLRGSPVNRLVEVNCRAVPFGAMVADVGAAPAAPGDQDHRTLQLSFQQKPVLTKLTMIAIVVAAALVLAFLVVRLRQTDELVLDVTAPEAPPTFTVEASGSTSAFLRWGKVPNALGYQVRETTPDGELGSEVAAVDAVTLSLAVEELEPATEHCFAVIAVGPEGAADSSPTPHECVTTNPPSQLPPPEALVVTPEGGGVFALAWQYPDTAGVEFAVLVDNTRQPELIVGLSTRVTIPQRDVAFDALIAVQAVLEGQASDPSAPQPVTVEALPLVSTTLAGGPTTVSGGATTLPLPPVTTAPGGGATTTTASATTTTVASPARSVLQDITNTPAAFLGTYRPESQGGVPLEQRLNDLALAFNVPAADIGVFTNRDTRIRDAVDTGGDLANLGPDVQLFYVARPTVEEATALCDATPTRTCGTFTLQGAASAAEGTTIVAVDRLDAATPITEVDAALAEQRRDLGRQTVFALDGAGFEGFSADEIVLFVGELGSPQDIEQFCTERLGGSCSQGVLTRAP